MYFWPEKINKSDAIHKKKLKETKKEIKNIVNWWTIRHILNFINNNSKYDAYIKNDEIRIYNWTFVKNCKIEKFQNNNKSAQRILRIIKQINYNKKDPINA